MSQDHRIVADTVRRDALELTKLLTAAKEVQWDASPPQRALDEVHDRQEVGGPPADPTSSVALDERRLKLREMVRAADNALLACAQSLSLAHSRLLVALTQWEGDEDV